MRVVDAGVVVELLAGGLDPELLGEQALAAPHLIDSEVTNVLRGLVRREQLTNSKGCRRFAGLPSCPSNDIRPTGYAGGCGIYGTT